MEGGKALIAFKKVSPYKKTGSRSKTCCMIIHTTTHEYAMATSLSIDVLCLITRREYDRCIRGRELTSFCVTPVTPKPSYTKQGLQRLDYVITSSGLRLVVTPDLTLLVSIAKSK